MSIVNQEIKKLYKDYLNNQRIDLEQEFHKIILDISKASRW